MKKTYLVLSAVLMCLCTFTAKAQDFEREIEDRLAFINEQLELDEEAQENFAVLYREYHFRNMEMKRERRDRMRSGDGAEKRDYKQLSDREAKDIIMRRMDEKERAFHENREFQMQMMEVIGPKKLLQMEKAEKMYRKKSREQSNSEDGGEDGSDM